MIHQPNENILSNIGGSAGISGQIQSETVYRRMMDPVKLRQRFPIALTEPVEQRTVPIYREIHQHPFVLIPCVDAPGSKM
jgi:hypothetical protein